MRVVDQTWEWVQPPLLPLQVIELAGRTCYKSEEKITNGSAERFAAMILKRGHESVVEHVVASVRLVTNRGVTHELVRHRICSFSQESTRYVSYKGDMAFIKPVWWGDWDADSQECWNKSMELAEQSYLTLLENGSRPEQAREVLPNSLRTEIVITANLREWRHIFKLRCAEAAHPQIRALMRQCLKGFRLEIPILFDDI